MHRVFKPKRTEGREWERWQQNVSEQVDGGQPLSDNEMLTYFGTEPSPTAENSALTERVNSLEKLVYTTAFDEQTARNALQLAHDNAILAWMGDI